MLTRREKTSVGRVNDFQTRPNTTHEFYTHSELIINDSRHGTQGVLCGDFYLKAHREPFR